MGDARAIRYEVETVGGMSYVQVILHFLQKNRNISSFLLWRKLVAQVRNYVVNTQTRK